MQHEEKAAMPAMQGWVPGVYEVAENKGWGFKL